MPVGTARPRIADAVARLALVEVLGEALSFWAKYSESLYHLALIVAGVIGIPLLISRTCSANRSARAALEQAKTAAERHDEQTRADRERRIIESFAKAVEQLGQRQARNPPWCHLGCVRVG